MRLKSLLFATAASLATSLCLPAHAFAESNATVFIGAEMIDGTGAEARKNVAIVIEGETITAIEDAATYTPPANAEIVDMTGQYVVPGLINVHEHMNTPPKKSYTEAMMRRELYGGVTAVRNPADDLRLLSEIARAARLNEIPSPDIYYAVMMSGPSFYKDPRTQASSSGGYAGQVPWMQAITDETDIPLAVAMARGTSATGLKIYANLPGHLVKALTEEAHRQGIKSWAHTMVFPATPEDAVDAGIDTLSHVCDIAYQAFGDRPGSYTDRNRFPVPPEEFIEGKHPVIERLYEKMAAQGTILDPTLYIYRPRELPPNVPPSFRTRCPFEVTKALTLQAHHAGVDIAAGTDAFSPWQDPFLSVHTEMELLQEAGMSPLQVIRSATLVGAKVIGQEDEMGTVETGKLANLVFVAEDPAQDVSNMRTVTLVVKRGELYPRAEYAHLTEEEARPRPMDSVRIFTPPTE